MSETLTDFQLIETGTGKSSNPCLSGGAFEKDPETRQDQLNVPQTNLELQAVTSAYGTRTGGTSFSRAGGSTGIDCTWGQSTPTATPARLQDNQPPVPRPEQIQPIAQPTPRPAPIFTPHELTPLRRVNIGGPLIATDTTPAVRDGAPLPPVSLRPADVAARPSDVPAIARPADAPVVAPRAGVLELQYGDPQFDAKLKAGNFDTLKITGFPDNARISPWLDNNGFFFWYINGNDNRARHYMPAGLRTIEVNGIRQDVDKMRITAAQAYALANDPNRSSNRAIDGTETVFQFGRRMSGLSDQMLKTQVTHLSEAAAQSNSPYLHLVLANYMMADVVRPIIANFDPRSNTVNLNDQAVNKALDAAHKEARKAYQLARQERDFFVQFQAERLEAMIIFSKAMMTMVPQGGFELPPILPGR